MKRKFSLWGLLGFIPVILILLSGCLGASFRTYVLSFQVDQSWLNTDYYYNCCIVSVYVDDVKLGDLWTPSDTLKTNVVSGSHSIKVVLYNICEGYVEDYYTKSIDVYSDKTIKIYVTYWGTIYF